MNAKILLIALSAAAFTSCSTAYKSTQTPDDVYYSPVRAVDESRSDDRREEARRESYTADDSRIRMTIRDYRWRDFYDDYDYSYRYSPYSYSYCNCSCNNYGYYYNPYYYRKPLYYPVATFKPAVNSTPRMVNLNGYKNYAAAVNNDPKTGSNRSFNGSQRVYNNNNNGESRFGRVVREVFSPGNSSSNSSNSSSGSNNNTRTYSPSSSGSSGSSSSGSSGGSSSSGSVSRPGRG